jgi:hypothetical protein
VNLYIATTCLMCTFHSVLYLISWFCHFFSNKSTEKLQYVWYLNSWFACSHEIHENWYPTNNNESTVLILSNNGRSWIWALVGQTKDGKIGICCFSAKQAVLRRKSKDWLAWNQDIVSEWGDMSSRGLFFQLVSTIQI